MSDTDEPTHRVVGKAHSRRGETFEPGATLTPTDAELAAFGDRFERVEPEGDTDPTASADSESESDTDTDTDVDAPSPDDYSVGDLPSLDYTVLQQLASNYPDVSGRASADEIRAGLRDKWTDDAT